MSGLKVALIGAGVAGPTMAIALKQLGMKPILYESGQKLIEAGAGISLTPNGLRMVDQHISSNLYQDLLKSGATLNGGFGIYYSDGACVNNKEIDMKAGFGYPVLGIRRHLFRKVCLDHCEKWGIPIIYNKKLNKLTEHKESVSFGFTDDTQDSADILLGCDGIHSATRKILFGLNKPSFTGMLQILGLSKDTIKEGPFYTQLSTTFGSEYSVGTYSLGNGIRMWFTKEHTHEFPTDSWTSGVATKEMIDRIKNNVQNWSGPLPTILQNTQHAIYWGIFDRPPLDQWYTNRIALMGDACHPMAPHLGQGANTSLEDVAVLSKLLASRSIPDAFQSYQNHRLPRTTSITNNARRMGNLGYTTNPIKRKIRDPILNLMLGQFYKYMLNPIYGYQVPKNL